MSCQRHTQIYAFNIQKYSYSAKRYFVVRFINFNVPCFPFYRQLYWNTKTMLWILDNLIAHLIRIGFQISWMYLHGHCHLLVKRFVRFVYFIQFEEMPFGFVQHVSCQVHDITNNPDLILFGFHEPFCSCVIVFVFFFSSLFLFFYLSIQYLSIHVDMFLLGNGNAGQRLEYLFRWRTYVRYRRCIGRR